MTNWYEQQSYSQYGYDSNTHVIDGKYHVRIHTAHQESVESHENRQISQDALDYRLGPQWCSLANCDGVSQSFYGSIASQFLTRRVLDWWETVPLNLEIKQIRSQLMVEMNAWVEEAKSIVESFQFDETVDRKLVPFLEKKRAYGSESMLVTARYMPASGLIQVLWIGDCKFQVWRDGRPEPAQSFSDDPRWSSNIGLKPSADSLQCMEYVGFGNHDALLLYSDGVLDFEPHLYELLYTLEPTGFWKLLEDVKPNPRNDDISLIFLAPGKQALPSPQSSYIPHPAPAIEEPVLREIPTEPNYQATSITEVIRPAPVPLVASDDTSTKGNKTSSDKWLQQLPYAWIAAAVATVTLVLVAVYLAMPLLQPPVIPTPFQEELTQVGIAIGVESTETPPSTITTVPLLPSDTPTQSPSATLTITLVEQASPVTGYLQELAGSDGRCSTTPQDGGHSPSLRCMALDGMHWVHFVREGDTVDRIKQAYGGTEVVKVDGSPLDNPNEIAAGSYLWVLAPQDWWVIPPSATPTTVVASDTRTPIAMDSPTPGLDVIPIGTESVSPSP